MHRLREEVLGALADALEAEALVQAVGWDDEHVDVVIVDELVHHLPRLALHPMRSVYQVFTIEMIFGCSDPKNTQSCEM